MPPADKRYDPLCAPRQPLVECLIQTLAFQRRADLRLHCLEGLQLRELPFQVRLVLVVVRPDFVVRHQDAGTKSLIDEFQHVQLPLQLQPELRLCEPVSLQLRSQPRFRTTEASREDPLDHAIYFSRARLRISTLLHRLTNYRLVD